MYTPRTAVVLDIAGTIFGALSGLLTWPPGGGPPVEPPGPPGGVGPTPLPVRLTRCRPEPSSPVISQLPVNGPSALGVNVTPSVSVWPGATVVPSGSDVVGANAPPNGGLDFWIVTLVPPVLVIVNVLLAVLPNGAVPKSRASEE